MVTELSTAACAGDQAPLRGCLPSRAHQSASLRRSAWARAGVEAGRARLRIRAVHAGTPAGPAPAPALRRSRCRLQRSAASRDTDATGAAREPRPWQRLARRRHALPAEPAPQGSLRAGEGAGVGALTAAALARRARGRGRAGRIGDARAGLGHDQRAGRVVPDLLAVARVREAQVHAGVPARQRACAPRAPLSPGAWGRRPPARWSGRAEPGAADRAAQAQPPRPGRQTENCTSGAARRSALLQRLRAAPPSPIGTPPLASCPLHVCAGRRRPAMLAGPAPDAHGKLRPPVRAPKVHSLRGGKHARAAPSVPRPPASATRFWPLHARTRQPASSAPHHTWPGCRCAAAGV